MVKNLWRLFTEKSAEHSRSAARAGFPKIDCLLNALPRSVTRLAPSRSECESKNAFLRMEQKRCCTENTVPCSRRIGTVTDFPAGDLKRESATLVRHVASPVTATTDFLAPDILNECGRAVPAPSAERHSTLAYRLRRVASLDGPPPAPHVIAATRTRMVGEHHAEGDGHGRVEHREPISGHVSTSRTSVGTDRAVWRIYGAKTQIIGEQ